MCSDSIQKIARLRQFLVSEGWEVSDDIRAERGLDLLTHPDHVRRQIILPVDTRYDDWKEVCDRALEKVAEMTGRDARILGDEIFSPVSTTTRKKRTGMKTAVFLAAMSAAFYGGMQAKETYRADPVSISLLGCMDHNAARAVAMMSYDAFVRFSDPSASVTNFLWTRQRALQAATHAEEMRRCYLEAQTGSEGFDSNGLIADDMDKIDAAITSVYGNIGASLVPGAGSGQGEKAASIEGFRNAENAANRLSYRLGRIVEKNHF